MAASFNSNEMSLWALVGIRKEAGHYKKNKTFLRVFNGFLSSYMIITAVAAHVRTGKVVSC